LSNKKGCQWCAAGKSTLGSSGTTCKNCPSPGWSGSGSGSMTTFFATIGVSTSIPFHSCPWGGEGWGCNGKGGRRTVTTHFVAVKSGTYKFAASVYDWGAVQFNFASGASAGRYTLERTSRGFNWPLSKGQLVSITFTCDRWGGTPSWLYMCTFHMKEPGGSTAKNLKLFKSNPGSSYCADPNIIRRL
jgi:hypothetical protein